MSEQTPVEVKRATCSHCAVCCGVLVEVAEDRPLAIRGDPDHPITKGFICKRGLAAIEYFDHPDRLNRPRKRLGTRRESTSAAVAAQPARGALLHPPPAVSAGAQADLVPGVERAWLSHWFDEDCSQNRLRLRIWYQQTSPTVGRYPRD